MATPIQPLSASLQKRFEQLQKQLTGKLYYDDMHRRLYATDASVYREIPLAVASPQNSDDIQLLVDFARQYKVPLLPRAAGTSLAGQCVGNGIVVDVSAMNQIIELNLEEKWVKVQPGVVRDELNHYLKPYGLFFAPETSTANRAMIGGMIGNNSCGANSIVYGSTRDHLLELHTVLSDGSKVHFTPLNREQFRAKTIGSRLENALYRQIAQALNHPENRREIEQQFPHPDIHRRNTGYALDVMLKTNVFGGDENRPFNFCSLLAGSEGTLAFTIEAKLNLVPLPPPQKVLLCAHFSTLQQALQAVVLAMTYHPLACELMDKIVLDCASANIEQQKNRAFVVGDPQAILMIEFAADQREHAHQKAQQLASALQEQQLGYHFPILHEPDIKKVWELRKAGLGVLANIPGDAKPVAVIEDTAVRLSDLPDYIADFSAMMERHGQTSVYYAHAGAGELHLRPILDLKTEEGVALFRKIATETAQLVKKYGGSLSGEHGDGRVRAEFIPLMVGEKNYNLFRQIKATWDPHYLFNPQKITDALPIETHLRYEKGQPTQQFDTVFDFSTEGGILRAAEKCNGSGDCRKLPLSGGTMCPSYMATRQEKDTTRARANMLREILTLNQTEMPFNDPGLHNVMDLCLGCKGCKSECPSNVDMATLKAEFMHHYQIANGISKRTKMIANFGKLNRLGSLSPFLSNFFLQNNTLSGIFKRAIGIAPQRSLPPLSRQTLRRWYQKNEKKLNQIANPKGTVYLFADEFTNYTDAHVGIAAISLLSTLGYQVLLPEHADSARTYLSKGLLNEARQLAIENIALFTPLITAETPLLGIEPSAILGFRDEFPKLVPPDMQDSAQHIAPHCLLIEEFLMREVERGNITPEQFTDKPQHILLHAHCHQKAIASANPTAWALSLPRNYSVELIPSGCCGMAGSFGYEAEHYELSMQVGELVLLPKVRQASPETLIAAPGTSCRHQIADGAARKALHPVEILWGAVVK